MLLIAKSEEGLEALEELADEDVGDRFAGDQMMHQTIWDLLGGSVMQFLVELAAFVLFEGAGGI